MVHVGSLRVVNEGVKFVILFGVKNASALCNAVAANTRIQLSIIVLRLCVVSDFVRIES